ncbi:MAG: hydrogenase maturation nickel metallochaperone HypA [Candidatus Hydrogenedentes bacterium]|nr:hydrogenase maturation nickel metallochaperone HypA [Candidatus Hydrogenedentota bacterium]MBI3118230.1 hydrogenase maturation nickel metallochaperone HypA [Candidatus Hydrogenedentota bacterium]
MHELSLVKSILEEAVRLAEAEGAERISGIVLQVGALRQVVPELMKFAFEAASQGTPAEGASFEWKVVPALVLCDNCETLYSPSSWVWDCPACGMLKGSLQAGDELVLETVELAGVPAEAPR